MADTKFVIFKVLEILFGIVIVGLAAGGWENHGGEIGYIIFAGVALIVVGLILLLLECIGSLSETVVSVCLFLFLLKKWLSVVGLLLL